MLLCHNLTWALNKRFCLLSVEREREREREREEGERQKRGYLHLNSP